MSRHTMAGDYEALAKEAAGSWRKWDCFCWYAKPDDCANWCIVYTSNRDSGITDRSNAAAIEIEMSPFTEGDDPDCRRESHGHCLVGYVDGYAIRVYKDGVITPAFQEWCDIQEKLSDYSILDEDDHSRREYDATLENIDDSAQRFASKHDVALPDDFCGLLYDWFSSNLSSAIENRDDLGGCPKDEELLKAFLGLEWLVDCSECGASLPHDHCDHCNSAYDHEAFTNKPDGQHFCCMMCRIDYCGPDHEVQA